MKLNEITTCLEAYAPLHFQESYDNAGLICGSPDMEITAALICIDTIEAVVDEAIENGCNLIIAHHPIVFSGIKKLNGATYIERVIIKAIKNDIAIYAAHTNLDNVHNGVSAKVAEKLGLENTQILLPKEKFENKGHSVGSGVIGDLPQAIDAMDFLKQMKQQMNTDCVRYTAVDNKQVRRIALCGGSGSFLLNEAIKQEADVFITGDFKYHEFFDAENKLIIADIGHYESEQYTMELFYDILIEKFSTFALLVSKINTNPIKYL